MIPDKLFKSLPHNCPGFDKYSNGQQVESGYKPDYVLKKDNEYIILESENSSSRKMYVGGMLKAAHFLQNEKTGVLIFVIKPKKNTRVSSIAKHLTPYFEWIKERTNLKSVYVIDMANYFTNNVIVTIGKNDFNELALKSLNKRF